MQKTNWHTLGVPECLRLTETTVNGISRKEAEERRRRYGENRLSEGERVSLLSLFFDQFRDFMVLVLMAATLISGLLGEYTDAVTIIAIIVVNGILGFLQEVRAERSLASLRQLAAPTAHVVRDGKKVTVQASELVPGDIVHLESGDRVPADLRLIRCQSLEIEESSLTGESLPVAKITEPIDDPFAGVGDRRNMAYMGTMVTRGKGVGVVVATGMDTEMGLIADLIQTSEDTGTPLQRRLEQLGKILVYVALAITLVVVVTGILHGHGIYEMFLAGVSLAVAAIPEGLPAIVTIALALGVQRMIRRRAIVRKLPSVETLGCASVICSDKTGTLTQNMMTVQQVWASGQFYDITGHGYEPEGEFQLSGKKVDPRKRDDLRRLLEIAVLCNNAELTQEKAPKGEARRTVSGDPTEGALLVMAAKAGITPERLAEAEQRLDELPFDSNRKMMSVLTRNQAGQFHLLVKGAPDVLLDRSSHILIDGKVVPMSISLRKAAAQANESMAAGALRNLGIAYRPVRDPAEIRVPDPEKGLIFLGLAGMIDPPRPEVYQAIAKCKRAGIKTVMITGDHQATAEAIARQIGILPPGGWVVNGTRLNAMSDKELQERVEDIYVYARVSPEHKLRIVKALQQNGHVVAMTGDGVNDAPAIKAADIGIAMGRTGTDVAKEASALVLSDDNFATIVAAIEEGRGIYDNIRKFVRYLLASNVGEILVMFLAMLAGLPLPLLPIQILWVNLVTDGLPAIALGVDPPEKNIMQKRPRSVEESIFARGVGQKILTRGLLIGIVTLGVFWLIYADDPNSLVKAQTMAFSTLVMAQLIQVFDCRSVEGGIFSRNIFENPWLVASVVVSALLLLGVIYIEPMQPIFKTVPLNLLDWVIVMTAAAIPTFSLAARRATNRMARRSRMVYNR